MHPTYFSFVISSLFSVICPLLVQGAENQAAWLVPVQTLVETKPPPPEKGTNPNRLAISPDGHWVAAVCSQSHALVLYGRRADDGTLTRVASIPDCAFHRPVFSADSRFLYVPSDMLQVYALDESVSPQ